MIKPRHWPRIEILHFGGQESWRLSWLSNNFSYPLQYSWASLVAQLVKNPACNVEDLGLIPGLGRSPEEGKGYHSSILALQFHGLYSIVHGVTKSWTQLSDFHFTSLFDLEERASKIAPLSPAGQPAPLKTLHFPKPTHTCCVAGFSDQ